MSSEEIIPIYAQGFFTVSRKGDFNQIIVFDYHDPIRYYYKILESEEGYNEEMARLETNMQYYLDREEVLINGRQVRPKVRLVDIGFRGDPEHPSVTFLIYFRGRLKRGNNIFENYYEETVLEYDYDVYWIFPPRSKIINVEVQTDYEVLGRGNILAIWGRKNNRIKGFEKITFKIL